MARFEKRTEELEAALRNAEQFPAEQAGQLLSRLISPMEARDAVLDALVTLVATDGTEPVADKYRDQMAAITDRWLTQLSRGLDGITDPDKGLDQWREVHATIEAKCFTGLDALALGAARDRMATLEAGLEKMTKDLQLKWDAMSYASKQLEAQEAEASRRMTEIVNESLRGATEAWARYGDALQRFLGVFQKVPDIANDAVVYLAKEAGVPDKMAEAIPKISLLGKDYFAWGKENGISAKELAAANAWLLRDPGMAVSETIQKAIGPEFEALVTAINALYKYALPIAAGAYAEQLGNYRRLLPNEGAILVSLGQTRRDVDEFLKTNGLDKARETFEQVQRGLEAWAGGLGSDGLRTDAAAFTREALEAFKRRYERMANAFGVFVQANQGRFIGAPSKAVEEELIFTEVWLDREQGLVDIGMDTRIREWRDGVTVVDDKLATASSQMFTALRHLPADISDSLVGKLNGYWSGLQSRLDREAAQADTTLAQAGQAMDDDQIRRDLDRRPLQAQLAQ